MESLLIYLLLALAFLAFFTGMEIAFFSAGKFSIELGKEHSRAGRILSYFNRNTPDFIGTMMVGNSLSLVISALLIVFLADPLFQTIIRHHGLLWLAFTVAATPVVLFFGEFIPRVFFRIEPLAILRSLAFPLQIVYVVLYLPAKAVTWFSRLLPGNGFRLSLTETPMAFSKVDLQHFVEQNTSESDESGGIDTELFENALYLREVKVRECMVPRTEVEGLSINSSMEELRKVFIESGYSRLPVFFKSLDNILGYVHHFDLLNRPRNIGSILMTIPVVPETMTARDLLNTFRREKKNFAQVVDEYGGTAGIVTMEDVLEELFGEIRDEHDEEDLLEKQLSADEYMFSGRLEIDYLNEKYDLELPEGDYETLAGFIVSETGEIPDMNQKISIGNMEFDILYASNKRIETVKVRLLPKA